MKFSFPKPAEMRKVIAYVATVIAALIAQGVLSGDAQKYALIVLAVLGALGIYHIPNADKPAK